LRKISAQPRFELGTSYMKKLLNTFNIKIYIKILLNTKILFDQIKTFFSLIVLYTYQSISQLNFFDVYVEYTRDVVKKFAFTIKVKFR